MSIQRKPRVELLGLPHAREDAGLRKYKELYCFIKKKITEEWIQFQGLKQDHLWTLPSWHWALYSGFTK